MNSVWERYTKNLYMVNNCISTLEQYATTCMIDYIDGGHMYCKVMNIDRVNNELIFLSYNDVFYSKFVKNISMS